MNGGFVFDYLEKTGRVNRKSLPHTVRAHKKIASIPAQHELPPHYSTLLPCAELSGERQKFFRGGKRKLTN